MGAQTMMRTLIAIDGERFLLGADEDVGELKRRIEEAVQAGGRFVDFEAESSTMSVLISPRSAVTVVGMIGHDPSFPDVDPPGIGLPDY
ncbi:hypothetical protein [Microbacterium sp.]|uniref:hypothetical protein n=1 Tax=Microbacterium sp. TaxID=51671 RepID=UPI0028122E33|nr:hypothetical protein [Microbacterium sp.]